MNEDIVAAGSRDKRTSTKEFGDTMLLVERVLNRLQWRREQLAPLAEQIARGIAAACSPDKTTPPADRFLLGARVDCGANPVGTQSVNIFDCPAPNPFDQCTAPAPPFNCVGQYNQDPCTAPGPYICSTNFGCAVNSTTGQVYDCNSFKCTNGYTCSQALDFLCWATYTCVNTDECDSGHVYSCMGGTSEGAGYACLASFTCAAGSGSGVITNCCSKPFTTYGFSFNGNPNPQDYFCGEGIGGGGDVFNCVGNFACNANVQFMCTNSASFTCGNPVLNTGSFQCSATTEYICAVAAPNSSFSCYGTFNCPPSWGANYFCNLKGGFGCGPSNTNAYNCYPTNGGFNCVPSTSGGQYFCAPTNGVYNCSPNASNGGYNCTPQVGGYNCLYNEAGYNCMPASGSGGYNCMPNSSSGGYNCMPAAASGGYNCRPSSGGYNCTPSSGGYNCTPSSGGYNCTPSSGGYNCTQEQGGYSG